MKISAAVLLAAATATSVQAVNVVFYPNIVCSGTVSVACFNAIGNFCCSAGSSGWFGIRLEAATVGAINAFSGFQCTGSEVAASPPNRCVGATFGQIAAGLVTGGQRTTEAAPQTVEINAVTYTNSSGIVRTARIPPGHATRISEAAKNSDLDVLDTLEDY